jgi:hypothetical protein
MMRFVRFIRLSEIKFVLLVKRVSCGCVIWENGIEFWGVLLSGYRLKCWIKKWGMFVEGRRFNVVERCSFQWVDLEGQFINWLNSTLSKNSWYVRNLTIFMICQLWLVDIEKYLYWTYAMIAWSFKCWCIGFHFFHCVLR